LVLGFKHSNKRMHCAVLSALVGGQWLLSSEHCDVIFSPIVDQIGVGLWPR